MASAAQSLRLCMRRCAATASSASARTTRRSAAAAATTAAAPLRPFSTTRMRCAAGGGGGDGGEGSGGASGKEQPLEPWELEMMAKEAAGERITSISQAIRASVRADGGGDVAEVTDGGPKQLEREARLLSDMRREFVAGRRGTQRRRDAFWNDEEADTEMITDEVGEDEFRGDDITSMAHGKLQELRERRHYARIAAWEMPLLSTLAKPFEPPSADMPLRFRYTSYMGEFHPAEKKVVVEFCPADLDLTPVQQDKLKKLAGPRFNPETEIVRMSCEQFEHQAQNKRYLGDLVEKLITEAKDPSDTFEDIPLDTRHHTFKHKPTFPKEWRMTDERRKQLQAFRAESFLADQKKLQHGALVDGAERIRAALAPPTREAASERVPELVRR